MLTRQELQQEAISILLSDHRLIVNWGTGVGKSRVAVGCADALSRRGLGRILLLVAETAHKDNWRSEFTGTLGEERGTELFSSLVVECYASMPKYENSEWDLIIADEAHHLRSENRTDLVCTYRTDYFLCLSATMSCRGDADDLLRMLEFSFGPFRTIRFGIQDAIDNDIIKKPDIHIHYLSLKDFKLRQTIKMEWGPSKKRVELSCDFEDRFSYLSRSRYPAATLLVSATPQQAYEYYSEKMNGAKNAWKKAREDQGLETGAPDNDKTIFLWNKYVRQASLRKVVLGKAKTTFSQWLLKRLGDKKYVCFCADIEQGEALGGENIIHSKKRNNLEIIEAFNRGDIRSLFAVNMIQEGQNLAGIQAGVIIQLGGKERQFVQKFGRALRSKTPEQHIVVIQGTRDEYYCNVALEGVNPEYVHEHYYGSASKEGKLPVDNTGEPTGRPASVPVTGRPGLSRSSL